MVIRGGRSMNEQSCNCEDRSVGFGKKIETAIIG